MGDPDLRGLVCNRANKVMRDKVEHDFSSVSAIVTASNGRGKKSTYSYDMQNKLLVNEVKQKSSEAGLESAGKGHGASCFA